MQAVETNYRKLSTKRTTPARRTPMRRSLARFVKVLQAQLPELTLKYHVQSLGIFGSYARYEEKPRSDLDLVVEFFPSYPTGVRSTIAESLSKLLGVKVELIAKQGLPFYIGKRVMREVIWLQKDGVMQSVKLPRRKNAYTNGKRNGAHMEPKREYLDYIQDMLDNMARVQRFVAGLTMDQMSSDDKTDYAVRYALQTIGEAANRIPNDVRKIYPQIPWRSIIDFRNAMAHGYDRMVYIEIWSAIHESIPRDQPLVAQMLEDEIKRRGVDKDESENQEPTA